MFDIEAYTEALEAYNSIGIERDESIKKASCHEGDKDVVYKSINDIIGFVVQEGDEYNIVIADVDENGNRIPEKSVITDSFYDEREAHEFLHYNFHGWWERCEKGKYTNDYKNYLRKSIWE